MIQSAQRLPYSDSCVQNVLRIRAPIQDLKISGRRTFRGCGAR